MRLAFAMLYGCPSEGAPTFEAVDSADDAPHFKPCSLEQMQLRKTLSRHPDISGVATLLLIHIAVPRGSERLVRSGEAISFSSQSGEASARAVSPWLLETLDPAGRPAVDGMPLSDGNMIRLRTVPNSSTDTGPPLVIVKADVPDQNRPTTCDAQIRDGDFVFIHTISPGAWFMEAPASGTPLPVAGTLPHSLLVNGTQDPSCVQDRETCITDKGGGLVCAWAPACAK